MSSTEPTTGAAASPLAVPPTTSVTNNSPSAVLGKDDFLKLLVTQLQNQDPTNPTDSSTWMAQLAQYSSLEQMTNVAQSVGQLVTSSSLTQGVELIGKQLTWTRGDGSTGIGVCDGMTLQDGSPVLDVGGEGITPDQITSVSAAPADSSPQTSTTA